MVSKEQLDRLRNARIPKDKKPKQGIRKVSKKKLAKLDDEKLLQKQDEGFYLGIWQQTTEHRCFECGGKLGRTPHNYNFHHILYKEQYPQFRYLVINLLLVCLRCHDQTHKDINKTPKIKEYTENLKQQLL